MIITLKQYAERNGKNLRVLQKKAKEGRINAQKIGRDWYIEEDAEVQDERYTTGQYVDWRKKKHIQKGETEK